ncbi:MAG: hypothetical protein ACI8RZ_002310 [Myxococcota bacterium]|jgi:hypothetical protein
MMNRSISLIALLTIACGDKETGSGNGTDDTSTSSDNDSGSTDDTNSPGFDTNDPPPDPDAEQDNLESRAGDYGYDLLRDAPFDSLIIEVDWVTGNEPDSSAMEAVVSAVEDLCNKPGGVQVVYDDELPPQGAPTWTYEAAQETELAWRDYYRDEEAGVAVIYYLYLDGDSEYDTANGRVLGYAYHGSSLIMFKETIDSAGAGLPLAGKLEDTVAVHELGHLLGLVDNGIEMVEDHKDPDHGDHDVRDDCIMYWAAETDSAVDLLLGGPLDFGAECRADVAAAGGRG